MDSVSERMEVSRMLDQQLYYIINSQCIMSLL